MADRLTIRLLCPHDEPRVRAGFARLGPASRQLRYGLSLRDAGCALDWVRLLGDGTHVAFGACSDGEPVGVARYVRHGEDAEAAVTVIDAWQGRGTGTVLLEALCAHARDARIYALRASVLAENRRARRLAERLGATRSRPAGGWLEYELPLDGPWTSAGAARRRCPPADRPAIS